MYWIELQYSNSSHTSLQSSILISVRRESEVDLPGMSSEFTNLPFKALNGWYFLLCVTHWYWSGGGGAGGRGSVCIAVKVSVCSPLSLTI